MNPKIPATVFLLIVFVFALSGCFSHNNMALIPQDDGGLVTKIVSASETRTDNRILILDVDGVITEFGQSRFFSRKEPTTFLIRQKLERALADESIKAVIVRINSPGGGVNASDVVYREIMDYKAQSRVPVVAMQMGVAASGGYYVSCAADKIIAHPNTVTGSIGVISFGFGFNGLFDKIGMESRVTKSGALKDMGNPFDDWTDEEKAAMQKIVDSMFARFLSIVKDSRKLSDEQLKTIADGRIFTADQAQKLGLIDRTGYMDDAIYEAMNLANIRNADVVMYMRSDRKDRNVYAQAQTQDFSLPTGFSMGQLTPETLLEFARPRLMYLWIGQ